MTHIAFFGRSQRCYKICHTDQSFLLAQKEYPRYSFPFRLFPIWFAFCVESVNIRKESANFPNHFVHLFSWLFAVLLLVRKLCDFDILRHNISRGFYVITSCAFINEFLKAWYRKYQNSLTDIINLDCGTNSDLNRVNTI